MYAITVFRLGRLPCLAAYLQGERVNLLDDLWPQGGVDSAVVLNTRVSGERIRGDLDVEMTLSALLKTGMATMRFAVINNDKVARRESTA